MAGNNVNCMELVAIILNNSMCYKIFPMNNSIW